jgi:anti-sigma-K factor RskA
MNTHRETQELLAPYALGAAAAVEARQVRAHLPECQECRDDLARLSEVVAALPLVVDEAKPPPRLRQRILATARSESAESGKFGGAIPDDVPPKVVELPVNSARRALTFRRSIWAPAAVAAAVVLALLGWNLQLQAQLNNRPGPVAAAVVTAPLKGTHGNVVGQITYLPQQRIALVSLHDLPSPAAGRTYQMWVIDPKGKPQPAGVFTPEGDGTKLLVLTQDIGHKTIAVTEEPLGGSPQPTTSPTITGAA